MFGNFIAVGVVSLFLSMTGNVQISGEAKDALTYAKIDAEKDAKPVVWFASSFCCTAAFSTLSLPALATDYIAVTGRDYIYYSLYGIGVLLPILGLLDSPAPPPYRLLGKSPDYVEVYTKAYQKEMKRHRVEANLAGCMVGTALGILAFFFSNVCYGCPTAD